MIKLQSSGQYSLIETKQQIKVLYLDNKSYVWLFIPSIGHVLETTHKPHRADHTLATGCYRIYFVKNESNFSDQLHLELFVGNGQWQGYLLLTGLPNDKKKKSRIIATTEIISKSGNGF
jgi:hypothetical protein